MTQPATPDPDFWNRLAEEQAKAESQAREMPWLLDSPPVPPPALTCGKWRKFGRSPLA